MASFNLIGNSLSFDFKDTDMKWLSMEIQKVEVHGEEQAPGAAQKSSKTEIEALRLKRVGGKPWTCYYIKNSDWGGGGSKHNTIKKLPLLQAPSPKWPSLKSSNQVNQYPELKQL